MSRLIKRNDPEISNKSFICWPNIISKVWVGFSLGTNVPTNAQCPLTWCVCFKSLKLPLSSISALCLRGKKSCSQFHYSALLMLAHMQSQAWRTVWKTSDWGIWSQDWRKNSSKIFYWAQIRIIFIKFFDQIQIIIFLNIFQYKIFLSLMEIRGATQ